MNFSHVHFYVDDAAVWQRWFIHYLSFEAAPESQFIPFIGQPQTLTRAVRSGAMCIVLSSPLGSESPAANYLRQHPSGVADLAFLVDRLEVVLSAATAQGAKVFSPIKAAITDQGLCRWTRVSGWGPLRHTLIEAKHLLPPAAAPPAQIAAIDHAVLNVPQGEMASAVAWYEAAFGFRRHQSFAIQTERSALYSQVLKHPAGNLQLPINEPTSPTSQIQEFLEVNRGTGIQHIALQTSNIVTLVRQLRQQGLKFLAVPNAYYETLPERAGFSLSPAQRDAIAQQEVLVDWQRDRPQTLLLQTFTQPIFHEPTFFFELIQRQTYDLQGALQRAEGFGEGNFQALFEAMEREQMKRGSL